MGAGRNRGRFDQLPSQDGGKDQKRNKVKTKIVPQAEFERTTRRLQVLHLTARLKLQSAITPVEFDALFQKLIR